MLRRSFLALVTVLVTALLPRAARGQSDAAGADVLVALDRWTRSFLSGAIDVTDPRPIDKNARPRLPARLLASNSQRLTELQALEILLRAAAELGTADAARRLLRLAAVGLDPKSSEIAGSAVVRGAAEGALDEGAAPAVHAHLVDVVGSPARNADGAALRLAAVRALGGSAQPVFWPVLTGLLREDDPGMRAAAARALGDLGRPQAIATVAQSLREEREPRVIQAIAGALRDMLDVAEHDKALDPVMHLDAIGAVLSTLAHVDDWQTAIDLVRFLEQHRVAAAVPVLIDLMARADRIGASRHPEARGHQTLKAEAHRVLQAMTGCVLGPDQLDQWREMWASAKDSFKVVPRRREALPENATVAGGFFGIPVLGSRVVFVIDCSGSMVSPAPQLGDTVAGPSSAPTRLDIACRECWNAIKEMGPDTYFNIVVFSSNAKAWKKELVPATPANKGALRNFLQRLVANGSTNLWAGLSTALEMRTAMTKSRYREPVDEVFVLSDGYPSSGEITEAELIAARVRDQNKHVGIRLNTVFIGSTPSELDAMARPGGDALMRVLAEQNQGTFVER
ncbi:MAG: HEAT repeat domain-containing protein [Planctomycetota bacterium]